MQQSLVGKQFGNYQLVSLLGKGGFAEVYLGRHIRLNKQAAIKILHAHLSQDELTGFEKEAQTIASLQHPQIVNVFDFDIAEGIPFLVMEYYPNGTLRNRHPNGTRVPLSSVVSYVNQVADALQYAHDQRIIHRDIKPANMLIGRKNDVLLSDFGIAAVAHNTSSMSVQAPMGTIPYMAPEQIHAQARPASDQYSLAVVAYEWLTGERPFDGSYTEIFAKHLTVPPPSLRSKVPDIASSTEDVILKALAKDPKERFSTILEFAKALEATSKQSDYQVPVERARPVPRVAPRPVPRVPSERARPVPRVAPRPVPRVQAERARPVPRVAPRPVPRVQAERDFVQDRGSTEDKEIASPVIERAVPYVLPAGSLPSPYVQLPIPESLSEAILEGWGSWFDDSLLPVLDIGDAGPLPFYFLELLLSVGVVSLWLWLIQHSWNWWVFGGSIAASVIVFFCGFVSNEGIKLWCAIIFGLSWAFFFWLLYSTLVIATKIALPGFIPWIAGGIAFVLFLLGTSIHCNLFKDL